MKKDFEEFIQNFKKEFEDSSFDGVKKETLIRDIIDLNSLNILVISSVFEFEYNKLIEFENIRKAETFHDLFSLTKS